MSFLPPVSSKAEGSSVGEHFIREAEPPASMASGQWPSENRGPRDEITRPGSKEELEPGSTAHTPPLLACLLNAKLQQDPFNAYLRQRNYRIKQGLSQREGKTRLHIKPRSKHIGSKRSSQRKPGLLKQQSGHFPKGRDHRAEPEQNVLE